MKNILKSDFYKLVRDRQTIAILIIYIILIMTAWPRDAFSLSTSELLNISTMDYGFILLLVTSVGSATFALDYSNATLKDILPYYSRKTVFQTKWILVVLSATITQLYCYLLGVISCLIIVHTFPSLTDINIFFSRFVIHYFLNIANISFILFLSCFFKRRAIINALTLISILMSRFFPIGNGQFLFNYLDSKYEWGMPIDFILIIALIIITFLFITLSYQLFRKREV